MSIRRKSFLIVAVTLFITISLLFVTTYLILTRSYQAIEDNMAKVSAERVLLTLNSTTTYLKNTSADWAYWDESYQFVQDQNSEYIIDNLSLNSMLSLDISFIGFLDVNGELVHSNAFDVESGEVSKLTSPPEQWIKQYPNLYNCSVHPTQESGILRLPEGPMIIVATPIFPSDLSGPCMGTLLVGRLLESNFLSELSRQTDSHVTVLGFDSILPNPALKTVLADLNNNNFITTQILNPQSIGGFSLLKDPSDKPVYLLQVETLRTISQQGRTTLLYFFWMLAILAIISTITFYFLINRILLTRIRNLHLDLSTIIQSRNPENRLPVDEGKDEISTLVKYINSTLDTLEDVQASYKILVENQEEGLVIVDEKENVLFSNPAANKFFGIKGGSLVGRNILSFLNWTDAARVRSETRERTTGVKGQYDIKVDLEDEPTKILQVSAAPRFDHQGKYIGSYAVFRDVTEVKLAREELETSERKFRSLVEQSRLGIFLLDLEGHIAEWNKALELLTAIKKEDVLGRPFQEIPFWITSGDGRLELVKEKMPQLQNFMVKNKSQKYFDKIIEINYQLSPEKQLVAELSLFPVRTDGSNQIGGIINDITEQKRMEKLQLEQRVFLEALRDTSEALNSNLDFESLLDRILVNADKVIPSDTGIILLLEEDMLKIVRTRGYAERGFTDSTDFEPFPISNMKNMLWMRETGKPIAIPDTSAYQGWKALPINNWVKSYIGMPLRVRQRTIGFLSLFSETPGFYTEDHAERLVAFASQTATAIENARLYSEVQQKADTDELTGLRNRRSLFELGSREVERAIRFNRPLSVLMIDLDYFKQINDSFGHPVGDRLLVKLAEQFRHKLRNVDLVGRYGGDEFIAILPENTIQVAEEIAHRLLSAIESVSIETAQGKATISASIGIAELNDEVTTLSALIERADRALYDAKESGRSRVVS